jgi:exopolysaccharide production protein ExoQ
MSMFLATLVCFTGIAGLFYLNRDSSVRCSIAIWLPVIWLWIVGSRSVSEWLSVWTGVNLVRPASFTLQAQLDGSPLDAFIFVVLLMAGIAVLALRMKQTKAVLIGSAPVLIFYSYCLASICWSHIPDAAIKRWIKDVGDLAMVLIIATDADPIMALRRVFSRVGFVLMPASILLIKYSYLGHTYDPDGAQMNTGVTDNKNSLGLIAFIIAIGAVWSLIQVLDEKTRRGRRRRLVAIGILLIFCLIVLKQAHSATSDACFVLGSLLILATRLAVIKRRPARIHALVLSLVIGGGLTMLLGGEATVIGAMGRDTTFTGRTAIWQAVIPMCPNALVGAGFESFWNTYGGNISVLGQYMHGVNEAHNGYIEVFLNLGWIGVGLIALVLVSSYLHACAAFRRNPEIGSLMLAFVAACAIYGITEASFRLLSPSWIILLLASVTSSRYLLTPSLRRAPRVATWPNTLTKNRALPDKSSEGSAAEKIPVFHGR